MYDNTLSTSHVKEYLGAGGLQLKIPFKKRVTRGCCPMREPSTSSWVIEIADRIVLIVRYCLPSSYCCSKNSKISLTGAENGSEPRPEHQRSHKSQAPEYADSVDFLHDFLRISITLSDSPSVRSDCLRWARRPVVDAPP